MDAYPVWWLAATITTNVLAAAAFGLLLWSAHRWWSVVTMSVLAGGGFVASSLVADNPKVGWAVFGALAALYAAAVVVMIVVKTSGFSPAQLSYAGLSSFGMVGVLALALRAEAGEWSPPAASIVPFLLVATAYTFAVPAGRRAYQRMIEIERMQDPRKGHELLLATWCIGLGVAVVGMPTLALMGSRLGFDVPATQASFAPDWMTIPRLLMITAVGVLGVIVAILARPTQARDDQLRVNPVAATLVGVALLADMVLAVHDLLVVPLGWPQAAFYFVLLGLTVGALYFEELISTPVLVNCFKPTRTVWGLAALCGLGAAVAVLWLAEQVLWLPQFEGAPFVVIGYGLWHLLLFFLVILAANLVVAFGSNPENQQLTAKSAASNAIQSQLLYGVLMVLTTCVPSILLARIGSDWSANVKPIGVFVVFAFVIWGLYKFTVSNNEAHLVAEGARDVPQVATRRVTTDDQTDLKQSFLARLASHLRWQKHLGLALFSVSLIGLGAGLARLVEHAKDDSMPAPPGPTTQP